MNYLYLQDDVLIYWSQNRNLHRKWRADLHLKRWRVPDHVMIWILMKESGILYEYLRVHTWKGNLKCKSSALDERNTQINVTLQSPREGYEEKKKKRPMDRDFNIKTDESAAALKYYYLSADYFVLFCARRRIGTEDKAHEYTAVNP